MTARLCVASYGEDVSWVESTGMEACIYDATGKREGLIPVRNRAREAGQYLRHIVANYGGFRDHEIFLQGNPFDHCPGILKRLADRPWERSGFHYLSDSRVTFDLNMPLPNQEHLLPFARAIGVRSFQDWKVGAMFAASREAIEARPLDWWKILMEKALAEPWSPWILEQLWPAIFRELDGVATTDPIDMGIPISPDAGISILEGTGHHGCQ